MHDGVPGYRLMPSGYLLDIWIPFRYLPDILLEDFKDPPKNSAVGYLP